jgi:hypothetical protein
MISAKFNFVGKPAKSAAPGTPARVLGSSAAPLVGKLFRIVANEKVGLAILAERETEKASGAEPSSRGKSATDSLF